MFVGLNLAFPVSCISDLPVGAIWQLP